MHKYNGNSLFRLALNSQFSFLCTRVLRLLVCGIMPMEKKNPSMFLNLLFGKFHICKSRKAMQSFGCVGNFVPAVSLSSSLNIICIYFRCVSEDKNAHSGTNDPCVAFQSCLCCFSGFLALLRQTPLAIVETHCHLSYAGFWLCSTLTRVCTSYNYSLCVFAEDFLCVSLGTFVSTVFFACLWFQDDSLGENSSAINS